MPALAPFRALSVISFVAVLLRSAYAAASGAANVPPPVRWIEQTELFQSLREHSGIEGYSHSD